MAVPIDEIKIGETYWMQNIFLLAIPVIPLSVVNGWVELKQGLVLPERIYKTKEDCPER